MTDAASTLNYEYLPGVLAEIARVAGLDAALKVAEAEGGRRVYIPCKPGADHWLTELVGQEAATAICDALAPGGRRIQVDIPLGPCGARAKLWRRIREMIAEGVSDYQIAQRLGVHRTTVLRHKNGTSGAPRGDEDPDQGRLF